MFHSLPLAQSPLGMPKRLGGIWSDTSLGPTLLEGLGVHPPHENRAAHVAREPRRSQVTMPSADALANLSLADLYGRSILRQYTQPPRRTFLSCAFDPPWRWHG